MKPVAKTAFVKPAAKKAVPASKLTAALIKSSAKNVILNDSDDSDDLFLDDIDLDDVDLSEVDLDAIDVLDPDVVLEVLVVTGNGEVVGKKRTMRADTNDIDPDLVIEDEEEVSATEIALARGLGDDVEENEDEDDEDDVPVVQKKAKKTKKQVDEAELEDDEDEDDEDFNVIAKSGNEFTCQSCFFILPSHLRSGESAYCRDCS